MFPSVIPGSPESTVLGFLPVARRVRWQSSCDATAVRSPGPKGSDPARPVPHEHVGTGVEDVTHLGHLPYLVYECASLEVCAGLKAYVVACRCPRSNMRRLRHIVPSANLRSSSQVAILYLPSELSNSLLLLIMVRMRSWTVFLSQTTSSAVISALSPPCTMLFRFL